MDNLEREILSRARYLQINTPKNIEECIRQAVEELLDETTIVATCSLFDVTREEYLSEDFYNQLYDTFVEIYVCGKK